MYLKYVENVIPLSKLIGLLFLFCLPLLSILFLKTKMNDLARPVMGTIFLVIYIYIPREISIEHPSVHVGLASLVWQAISNKSKRQVQIFYLWFNVRFNVRFKFQRQVQIFNVRFNVRSKYSTSGSNFNLTFNIIGRNWTLTLSEHE